MNGNLKDSFVTVSKKKTLILLEKNVVELKYICIYIWNKIIIRIKINDIFNFVPSVKMLVIF